MTEHPPSISVHGVTKRFGGVTALHDVNAEWTGPGIVGLIGPNGSGKSTLMGVISGVVRPTRGTLAIDGATVRRASSRKLAGLGIARTFQISRVVPTLRVWENIVIGEHGRVRLVPGGSRRALGMHAAGLAEEAGIAHILDRWPHDVTLADQKRIEIARALAVRPRILLLDEPTAGLSGSDAATFIPLIRRAASTALVIIVEHNMQMIGELASICLALVDGEVVAEGSPAAVLDTPIVRESYVGAAHTDDRPEVQE